MKVDLHIHSTFSDGEYTPSQILEMCDKLKLDMFAITDHNNLGGSKEVMQLKRNSNIKIISGIELNAKAPANVTKHILGYDFDLEDTSLNEITKAIMEDNVRRIKSIISELYSNFGIKFKDEDVEGLFVPGKNIGRPEVAKLCLKYGYVQNVEEAFSRLLDPIRDKVVKRKMIPTDKECIKYITKAGGIACLAHPVSLNKSVDELRQYIFELMEVGLSAVEVYHSSNPEKLVYELEKMQKEYGFLTSVGSDYHGPIVKPGLQIASGKNGNLVNKKATIVSKFREVSL